MENRQKYQSFFILLIKSNDSFFLNIWFYPFIDSNRLLLCIKENEKKVIKN